MTIEQLTRWYIRNRAISLLEAQKLAETVVIRRKLKDASWDNPFCDSSAQSSFVLEFTQKIKAE